MSIGCIVSLVVFLIIVAAVTAYLSYRSRARLDVLGRIDDVFELFKGLDASSKNDDVKESTRRNISITRKKLNSLSGIKTNDRWVDWFYVVKRLDQIEAELSSIRYEINRDISFCEMTRVEVPIMIDVVDNRISETEKMITELSSKHAYDFLQKARAQFKLAKCGFEVFKPNTTNWGLIYSQLVTAQRHLDNAIRTHCEENEVLIS